MEGAVAPEEKRHMMVDPRVARAKSLASSASELEQKEALSLLQQAAADGDPEALYALGTWYLHGKMVALDYSKGADYLEAASARDFAQAHFDLAVCLETGRGRDLDPQGALSLYKKAVENGDLEAAYEVGRSIDDDSPGSKANREALGWYRVAAKAGSADAQYALGRAYELGAGLRRNRLHALSWYRKAARQDHDAASEAVVELVPELEEGRPASSSKR